MAERRAEQLSATMANRLADMYEIAPQLTAAVAKRISSGGLHARALQDLGAFVHRTVVEDEYTYAVRIDDGAMLDATEQIGHARVHLSTEGRRQIADSSGPRGFLLRRRPRRRRRAPRRRRRGRKAQGTGAGPARSGNA